MCAPGVGLEDGGHDAVRGGDGQQVEHRGLQRVDRGAQQRGQDEQRDGDHERDDQPQPVREPLGDVGVDRLGAGDQHAARRVRADRVQQPRRRGVARPGGRLHGDDRRVACRVEHRPGDGGDSGQGAQRGGQRGRRVVVRQVNGDQQRRVSARPVLRADQVIRLPDRAARGLGARVFRPGAHAEDRRGERQQDRDGDRGHQRGPPGHPRGPRLGPGPPDGGGRVHEGRGARRAGLGPRAARQDAAPRQRAQRGHQRQRGRHDRGDADVRGVADRRVRLQRRQLQTEQRHDDGEARDEHRGPGLGGGPLRRQSRR